MNERQQQISENLANVRKKIKEACEKSRRGNQPLMLAATKTVPACDIAYAIDNLGLDIIGENRVNELVEKYDELFTIDERAVERRKHTAVHFIGTLQTNKVKYIIDKVDMIQSLDSEKLAAEIDRLCKKNNRSMDVLIEVNIGREENKSGVMPEQLEDFLCKIEEYSSLRIRGIMTMAPKCTQIEDFRKFFKETYALFIDISEKKSHNIIEPVLSMGMSDSFTIAIEEGADIVRIGSAIFGARTQPVL